MHASFAIVSLVIVSWTHYSTPTSKLTIFSYRGEGRTVPSMLIAASIVCTTAKSPEDMTNE